MVGFLEAMLSKKTIILLAFIKLINNSEDFYSNPLQRPYCGDFDTDSSHRKPGM
jgi:hypothetical protein